MDTNNSEYEWDGKKKRMATFEIDEEVKIKECSFKITGVNVRKNKITFLLLKKFKENEQN